jgi:hypothetical protein
LIYEKWDTRFDIARLQEHVEKYVLPLESVQQSPSFGGWSVLSSDGSYKDGWLMGHKVISSEMSKESLDQNLKNIGFRKIEEYKQPTEICHGYLKEVMDFLLGSGLNPRRARIIRLTKGMRSSWHRDGPDNRYFVRLHVPIITNSGCIFEAQESDATEVAHMPADGSSYILRVNRMHRVSNNGDADRFHLVMDVWDTRGITKHHRYDASLDER